MLAMVPGEQIYPGDLLPPGAHAPGGEEEAFCEGRCRLAPRGDPQGIDWQRPFLLNLLYKVCNVRFVKRLHTGRGTVQADFI